jgi:hypothetical protein
MGVIADDAEKRVRVREAGSPVKGENGKALVAVA